MVEVWTRKGRSVAAALGGVALFSACGGAPSRPAPPPAPSAEARAAPPQPVQATPTDTEPGQLVPSLVFGVDLDTVQAGPFDQGKMWTFELPPTDYLDRTYGFRPDAAWYERARLGALRIPSCSASFVSADGLVLTNHHCAREFITQVARQGESLLDSGFVATDLADERAVEDFEADQLVEIVDVTEEVNARLDTVPRELRAEARESVLEEIESRLLEERGGEEAGMVVEMISLYDGGRTSGYVFRRYTDVKLVMAPEVQIGFFGGDPDNFTYPRYNLDFAFFRVYDGAGRPLATPHYFPVDDDGLGEGDLVFTVGNPGSTSRLQTVAQLEYRRDVADRALLELLRSRMGVLDAFIRANPEEAEARDLRNEYFSLANSEEAYAGQIRGLQDPVILARRLDTERDFQAAIDASPELSERYGGLIEEMRALQEAKREVADVTRAFIAFGNPYLDASTLIRGLWASQVLIMQQNGAPPDEIEGMIENLAEVPQTTPELETALMAARFRDMRTHLGEQHPSVRSILRGRSPEDAAAAIVQGSVLADSAGAVTAVRTGPFGPQDPALQTIFALLEPFILYNNTLFESQPQEDAIAAELGRARLEIYGTDAPPDATFSLRIADGVTAGYEYNGTEAPWFTTFYGLWDRHHSFPGREEWALPHRWRDVPGGLDLTTPLNFAYTADIIGGNSGSPVLDRDLEVVGVVFDGNAESLPGDYIYLPELNRAVATDIRAVIESLDVVYDADRLVAELRTGRVVATEAEADRRR